MRDWLSTTAGGAPLPGGDAIASRFFAFSAELPATAAKFRLTVNELTFKNYAFFALEWLRDKLASAGDPLT